MEIRICPSILNADHARLKEEIERVARADLLHLDVMDGIFVPNQTFSLEQCREIIEISSLPVDAHLMIADPDERALLFAQAGAASVTFHFEASTDPRSTISQIRSAGARVGLAIKPHTKFHEVAPFLEELDMLLIMTVEPGFGGQRFMESEIAKIEMARSAIAEMEREIKPWLQVDGGISIKTISLASKAGADTFVAGTAIFNADDSAEMIIRLRELARL